MKGRHILIVDDDPEDREILKDAIDIFQQDATVYYAENGEQALDILSTYSGSDQFPCLVVLDLNMPKMNGTETLRRIKNKEELKKILVVIYSTSVNPVEKEICLQLGAHDYITKPVSFAEGKTTAQKLLALCSANSSL